MRYHDIDISIDIRTEQGFLLRAESEKFGETRSFLTLDDPECADIEECLECLEQRNTDEDFLIRFGTDLYHHLFKHEIENLFQQTYGYARNQPYTGIRIRLKIQPPEAAILPWELLWFPTEKRFMGTSIYSPIIRYLEIHQKIPSLQTELPVNILVVIPENPELDTHAEKENLIRIFDELENIVKPSFLEGIVTYDNISDALMDIPFHCFHFIGHGDFKNNTGWLLLNTKQGEKDYVDEIRFAALFQNHPPMKLIVLNSCEGAKISDVKPLAGMAPNLVERGIPAVIAMQHAIYDDAAVLFAREFYRKLFKGWDAGRVDVAITHARNRLTSEFPHDREICTPVLFTRAKEGVLFNLVTGNPLKDIPLSNQKLDTVKAVEKTYKHNLAIEQDSEKSEVLKDTEELRQLRQRLRFRNYLIIIAATISVLMFFFSWINLFDSLTLDTKIESCTMWLGDQFREKEFSEKIRLIVIQDESFGKDRYIYDKNQYICNRNRYVWRKEKHPVLLDKLSQASAKLIIFDMYFQQPCPEYDVFFTDAIKKARSRGTDIIAGVRESEEDGKPKIIKALLELEENKELKKTIVSYGIVCKGEKLGIARIEPLAVKKDGSTLSSLAMKAYETYHGYEIISVSEDRQIILRNQKKDIKILSFSELTKKHKQKYCPIIQDDDAIAEMFIDLTPIEKLKIPDQYWEYNEVIKASPEKLSGFKDKIVFIGSAFKDQHGDRLGVELHADALNTLLNETVIRSMAQSGQFFIMVIMGLTGAFIRYWTPRFSRFMRSIAVSAILTAYFAITILIYVQYFLLLNTLYHVGAFWIAYWAADKTAVIGDW